MVTLKRAYAAIEKLCAKLQCKNREKQVNLQRKRKRERKSRLVAYCRGP